MVSRRVGIDLWERHQGMVMGIGADSVKGQLVICTTNPDRAARIAGIYQAADEAAQAILDGKETAAAYDPEHPPQCTACGCPGMMHPTSNGSLATVQNCQCGRCPGYRPTLLKAEPVQAFATGTPGL